MKGDAVLAVESLELEILRGRSRKVVRNVSFSVPRGRVTCLVGESGCGKSLTCLAILGLLPEAVRRTGGTITIDGERVNDLSPEHLQALRGGKAAMILQNPMSCFDPICTVKSHFLESLAAHGGNPGRLSPEVMPESDLARARRSLAEVGFDSPDDILDAYPFQLSGGMLQRVMVALALLSEIRLLLADEPTTDLDVVSQARILTLLDETRRRHGMGVLLVTHDIGVVARMADFVVVMHKGEVVEQGEVATLFAAPRHAYTRALLQAHLSLYGLSFGDEAVGVGTVSPEPCLAAATPGPVPEEVRLR